MFRTVSAVKPKMPGFTYTRQITMKVYKIPDDKNLTNILLEGSNILFDKTFIAIPINKRDDMHNI